MEETSISRHFGDMPDPRDEGKVEHPLLNIITIAILGVLCGAEGWVDIERYGQAKQAWLGTFLDLSNGIPSHDTFGRVFRWLDSTAFQARFVDWTQELCRASQGKWVDVDGKQLRGSQDAQHQRGGIWLVSAWASEQKLVLGQLKVDDKSNEITAIPELLGLLDIKGCVVSVDAMGTQTEIAKTIVQGGADYVLALKGNQGTLHEDVAWLFEGFEQDEYRGVLYDTYKTVTEAHHRREVRQCWVVSQAEYRDYLRRASIWPKLTSLVKVLSVRSIEGKTSVQVRYFISSWSASAHDFLRRIREHWQIENGLHWVLDIAFNEDHSRIRLDHAPQNMALLRHIALNLLKQERSVKVGLAAKRKMVGWDNTYLLKVLCPS